MNTPTGPNSKKKNSAVNMKKSSQKQTVPPKKIVNTSSEIRQEAACRHLEALERSHLYQIKRLLLKQGDYLATTQVWVNASFYLLIGLAGVESARVVLWMVRNLSFY